MRQDEEDTDQHRDWQPVEGIYALGDCCAQAENPLPALAQVGRGVKGAALAAGAAQPSKQAPACALFRRQGSRALPGACVASAGNPCKFCVPFNRRWRSSRASTWRAC